MSVEQLGGTFQQWNDPSGNPLIAFRRNGQVFTQGVSFPDGTTQNSAASGGGSAIFLDCIANGAILKDEGVAISQSSDLDHIFVNHAGGYFQTLIGLADADAADGDPVRIQVGGLRKDVLVNGAFSASLNNFLQCNASTFLLEDLNTPTGTAQTIGLCVGLNADSTRADIVIIPGQAMTVSPGLATVTTGDGHSGQFQNIQAGIIILTDGVGGDAFGPGFGTTTNYVVVVTRVSPIDVNSGEVYVTRVDGQHILLTSSNVLDNGTFSYIALSPI